MSAMTEISGVVLAFVTRVVMGKIETTTTSYNNETQELDTVPTFVENPVIVFFPNGTSQIFSESDAEKKGFLQEPEILNFGSVVDKTTPAGRFKHAIRDEQRRQSWLDMENAIISKVISKSGHPLPNHIEYEKTSVILDGMMRSTPKKKEAA